ncbi:MAG: phenylacetate-CoA oxygenase subunit PaaC [Bacteroidetes bacterium]|nr:phenylacetate-CoA oxygenase subunit PaaC [Bacteroidota bacterium]
MKNYLLQLADNALILGHRLGEWCGHAPEMELDIALTNIALDLTGQARSLYQRVGELEGASSDGVSKTEDDYAYLRDVWEFRNVLLVEQPNGDFAQTIVRQFIFDSYHFYMCRALTQSTDEWLSGFAEKSLKEITYHLRFSSEWMQRLGDGTEVSHAKMQTAIESLWTYSGELITPNEIEKELASQGIGVDLNKIKPEVTAKISEVLAASNLTAPEGIWMQKGGKDGRHSEHLGYILAEMQFLQRAYPGQAW